MPTIHVYCDESCHLPNDHQMAMTLGALSCPSEKVREANARIRAIKAEHGLNEKFEIKWTKVSPAKEGFYLALVDYFFDNPDLHFRAVIIPDKNALDHERFDQTHDDWYYKMYFDLLKVVLSPDAQFKVFLDIKDNRSAQKVRKLHEVLTNNMYDFSRTILQTVQNVHSHELETLQLCDLLTGAISYANRELGGSSAKLGIIDRIRQRSGYQLTKTTLLRESKLNLLRWTPAKS